MAERIAIFANPIAGRGRGRAVADDLSAGLTRAGYAVTVHLDRPEVVDVADRPAAVVTIGGDGTLRAVVDRYLSFVGGCPPMLPVSMGTANLMARHLGLRWTRGGLVPAVVALVRAARVRHLDVGRCNGRPFLLMAGVGLDGRVVHLLDALRQGPIDYASYVLPTVRAVAEYRFAPVTITVDGRAVLADEPAIVFVGNVAEYGTGLPILTRAVPDDGLLDVCALPCRDARRLAELLLLVAAGEHPLAEGVVYTRASHVTITSAAPLPVQVDGDPAGFTPVEIDVLPGRVPFLVPA